MARKKAAPKTSRAATRNKGTEIERLESEYPELKGITEFDEDDDLGDDADEGAGDGTGEDDDLGDGEGLGDDDDMDEDSGYVLNLPSKPREYAGVQARGGMTGVPDFDNARVGMPVKIRGLEDIRGRDIDESDADRLVEEAEKDFGGGAYRTSTGRVVKGMTIFPPTPGNIVNLTWKQFSDYWRMLWQTPEYRPRIVVYIYRMFPVMKANKRRAVILYGEPESGDKSETATPMTIEDVLHRLGTGDYQFWLNDKGAGNKNICKCSLIRKSELRDWENHPPVLDIENMDLSDPANKSYIENMRQRGVRGVEGDEEDMKNGLEVVERMAEKMVDMARERERPKSDSPAEAGVVQIVADASRQAMEIVAGAAKERNSNQNPNQAMEMFMQVATLLKDLRGDSTESMRQVMEVARSAGERERDLARQHQEFLITMLKESLAAKKVEQPVDPLAKYREILEMKELLKDVLEVGGGRAPKSDWMSMLPQLAPLMAPVIQSISLAVAAVAARSGVPVADLAAVAGAGGVGAGVGAGMGNPGAQGALGAAQGPGGMVGGVPGPGMAPGGSQGQGQGSAQGQEQGMGPDGASGAGQGTGDRSGLTVPVEFQSPEAVQAYMQSIQGPLLRMMNTPGIGGADFAQWLIDWKGEEHYLQLTAFGADTIGQLLLSYPPIQEQVASRPQSFIRFVQEFVAVADTFEEGDGSDEVGGEGDDDGGESEELARELARELSFGGGEANAEARSGEGPTVEVNGVEASVEGAGTGAGGSPVKKPRRSKKG